MKALNHDKLPAPGIYRLKHSVKNPNGDKRIVHEFARLSVWEAGMRVVVLPSSERWLCFAIHGYRHHGIMLDVWSRTEPKDVIAADRLIEALDPEPPSVRSVLFLSEAETMYSPILRKLFETGKITLDDVSTAVDQLNAEPE